MKHAVLIPTLLLFTMSAWAAGPKTNLMDFSNATLIETGAAKAVMAEIIPAKVWKLDDLVARGERVYAANCAACHRPDGKGAGPIKPLDGAAVVQDADKTRQISVLLNGQNNGAMPSWKQLSDTELAAVITYTKNHWSNKTGQVVQPSEVVAARK